MFLEFFSKEVITALKKPMIYIFIFIVALLVFGAVVSDNVIIGGVFGDVKKNAPTVVANYVAILNIFGLLFATAFFNNAALRDYQYGFQEIMFTTPINKNDYFFGRFCGAWLLSTLVMLGIYLAFVAGAAIGPAMHWIGAERVGPTPWLAFLTSYLLFVVPNMFFAGAIIFALATQFKSTIISFVGTLFIIIGYIVSLNLASDIDNQATAALIDVFGIAAYTLDTEYFTPLERNTLAPAFSGYLLLNRMLWFAVGLVILFIAAYRFSFATKNSKQKKQSKKGAKATAVPQPLAKPVRSTPAAQHTGWATFGSFFKTNALSIGKSTTFVILLLFAIILLVSNLWGGFEYFGLKSYPVTYKMIDEISSLANLFVLIVLVFFSGELVWRDRDSHLNEVVDATPHHSVISLLAKTASLVVLGSVLHLVLILVGMLYQTFNGYTNYEVGVYLTDFLTDGFVLYLVWGTFLVFLQVLVNQKYLGYFVSVLFLFMLDVVFSIIHVESKMFLLGETPQTAYSDMNGFGPASTAQFWFSNYWVLFGLLSLIIAGLFWPRGLNHSLKDRFATSRKSLGRSYFGTLGFFGLAWLAVGAFVFYNTQVLNPYKTSKERELMQVQYEKDYKKYENVPLPMVTDLTYYIDIYPAERTVKAKVDLLLRNNADRPIDSLHFTLDTDDPIQLDIPNSKRVFFDEKLGYCIYQLHSPLQPGDSLRMVTHYAYAAKGFENEVTNMSVLTNGTFFNNRDILPGYGYQTGIELSDKNKRRKYDLPERARMPELQANCTDLCRKNYISGGRADWVNVETYISTSADQIAIAPGSLLKTTEKDGRRQYHYRLDHPSQNFYSFMSADYQVATRKWEGIDLEVYYDRKHAINVDRMLDAMQKSLAYYTTHFGPYYHQQARIIEFPRYASFAQAFPGTMPYSEAIGFIIDLEGEDKNNVIDAVIAHEIAHQYWAHQVIGAEMQGATMLSESFAEYSALMVMKQETTPLQMKDLLKYDLQRYLRGRSSESDKELPLMKVENQGHIHYGKGAVILYALQNYIGEDSLNLALKNFLEAYRYQDPPYPTSLDFMRYLKPQVPDSLQYLIKDWFEDITLYDLRLKEVTSTKTSDGKYELTLDLIAKKTKADPDGTITEVPIADWVDIGFYADNEEKELVFQQRVYLDQENAQLKFVLDSLPAEAAVDPLRLLIDRIYDDNSKKVTLVE
jgi:ABC-2 type transport system permease protein